MTKGKTWDCKDPIALGKSRHRERRDLERGQMPSRRAVEFVKKVKTRERMLKVDRNEDDMKNVGSGVRRWSEDAGSLLGVALWRPLDELR